MCIVLLQSKQYPREPARDNLHTGRVRVQLRKGDGSLVVPEITSSKDCTSGLTC